MSDRPVDDRQRRSFDRAALLAMTAFVIGTFTWRVRSAAQLDDNPVDAAATARIVADVLSAALAVSVLLQPGLLSGRTRLRGPALLYAAYIGVVLIGAAMAVDPALVVFRAVESAVCLIVGLAVVAQLSLERMVQACQSILFFLALAIAGSAVVLPAAALYPSHSDLLPFRLTGALPVMSSNSVGMIGVLLVAISLGTQRMRVLGCCVGVALVLLSQYRTGYVALVVVAVVWLLIRKGWGGKALLALLAVAATSVLQAPLVQEAWSRGEPAGQSADTLSGRTDLWAVSLAVAHRSPWLGTGLSSGLRFEVAPRLAFGTVLSTAHNTWIEAYLGTGLIGTAVLLLACLWLTKAALHVRGRTLAPAALTAALFVRSLTGASVELAGLPLLLFLILGLGAWCARTAPADGRAAVPGVREPLRTRTAPASGQPATPDLARLSIPETAPAPANPVDDSPVRRRRRRLAA